jgi:Ion transport protein
MLFKFDGIIRKICHKVVEHHHFENVMIFVTIISSIQLGVDNPLNDPDSTFSKVIIIVDYTVTAIFSIEALMKIIANGFLLSGSRSYIRDSTNILDFLLIIVTVSFLNTHLLIIDSILHRLEQPEFNQITQAI